MAVFNTAKKRKRVFVLSIDGVPHSFLQSQMAQGRFPHLRQLVGQGAFARMRSVYPTISSVAWSSFMTGKNPAKHGIFGFVDRRPNSYEVFIPTSLNMTSKTLWELLSEQGKTVVVINVPVTYPPRPVNGILVSCFLATSLAKATYPPDVSGLLQQMGYRIDVDAALAHQSLDRFLEDLHLTLEKRILAMNYFLDHQPWDYFHLHIMGTDRINHFLWAHMERGDAKYLPAFLGYYDLIDQILGDLVVKLPDQVVFILMSDHGFCTIREEVNLSRYLAEKGLLRFTQPSPKNLGDIHPDSQAYSLIPGRVYLNLEGREPKGSVPPSRYHQVRDEIAAQLWELRLPQTGDKVIQKVLRREEIYHGEHLAEAADLMAIPCDGFDLKADVKKACLTERTAVEGMHTYDDATLFIRGQNAIRPQVEIVDLLPTICALMDVPVPDDVDGQVAI